MNADRYEQLRQAFLRGREIPPSERERFLDQTYGGDPELRRELRSLLDSDSSASRFLDQPVLGDGFSLVSTTPWAAGRELGPDRLDAGVTAVPIRLGNYRVLRLVGEGGMGVVYEAEQENPRRRVALKVIRPGFCSPRARLRFDDETTALGRLAHPGIAQILEVGTQETPLGPLPFFAMEFIDGRPLTQFIQQELPPRRERLHLFLRLCDAVQHAHQKGVIHLDLKPANVLVDPAGSPKIIDFGVARAMSDSGAEGRQTLTLQVGGTLAYMSPEQFAADATAVDVRSDVYSLGVMLHELLCGTQPFDLRRLSLASAERVVRESPPPRLSRLDAALGGDLELIVLKALAKSPAQRYQSAADLAADVRHFMDSEPISARPPRALYQAMLFARRRKALVATMGLTIGVSIAFGISLAWMYAKANADRLRAQEAEQVARRDADRANCVGACLNALLAAYGPNDANTPGQRGVPNPKQVLEEGAAKAQVQLRAHPRELAGVLMDYSSAAFNLQFGELADQIDREAYDLVEAMGPAADDLRAHARAAMAWKLDRRGRPAEAERLYREVFPLLDGRMALVNFRCHCAVQLAGCISAQGRTDEALHLAQDTLALLERVGGPPESKHCVEYFMASEYARTRKWQEAGLYADRALAHFDKAERPTAMLRFEMIAIQASAAMGLHDHERAQSLWRLAIADWEHAPRKNADAFRNLVDSLLASCPPDARAVRETVLSEAIDRAARCLGPVHHETLSYRLALASERLIAGDCRGADALYQGVADTAAANVGLECPDFGAALLGRAEAANELGDLASVEAIEADAHNYFELAQRLPADHPHRSGALLLRGVLDMARADYERAEAPLRECIAARQQIGVDEGRRFQAAQSALAECLIAQRRFDEAESLLLDVDNHYQHLISRGNNYTGTLRFQQNVGRLVVLYEAAQRPADAAPYRDRLIEPFRNLHPWQRLRNLLGVPAGSIKEQPARP